MTIITRTKDATNPPQTDGFIMGTKACQADFDSSDNSLSNGGSLVNLYDADNYRCEKTTHVISESIGPGLDTYTTCYDPSLTGDEGICKGTDRKGNTQWSCFPAVGDNVQHCRSSCVNGTLQDYIRTLHNISSDMTIPNCKERGVELYENWGLDETIRVDSGRYGDNDQNNTCITELGRKLTLYGNVRFFCRIYYTYSKTGLSGKSLNVGASKYGNTPYFHNVYTIQFPNTDASAMANRGYDYFGNSGVVFTRAGIDYPFINGQIEEADNKVIMTKNDSQGREYVILDSNFSTSSWSNTWGMQIGNFNPLFSSNADSETYVMKNSATLFPASYYSYDSSKAYKGPIGGVSNSDDGWGDDGEQGITDYPGNCSQTGIRSAYIPPHMQVNAVNFYTIPSNPTSYNFLEGYRQYDPPLRYEQSPFQNGTFHGIGTTTANTLTSDSDYYSSATSAYMPSRKTAWDIPAISIFGIAVSVRQDDAFYSKYISSAGNTFAPEIFLIPGIINALNFPQTTNVDGFRAGLIDDLQKIKNPQDLWSKANGYWNGEEVVLKTQYSPGEVLYRNTDSAPIPSTPNTATGVISYDPSTGKLTCSQGTADLELRVMPSAKLAKQPEQSTLQTLLQKLNSKVIYANKKITANLLFQLSDLRRQLNNNVISLVATTDYVQPTGLWRIVKFEPINGVMSIEWLYVLFYCAMNTRKMLQFDPTQQKYTLKDCAINVNNGGNVTCAQECMLFRDPYNAQTGVTTTSASDLFMLTYCGMRNLSVIYAPWKPLGSVNNECSCCSNPDNLCKGAVTPACTGDSTNTGTYVSDFTIHNCNNIEICQYCSTQVFQLMFAESGGCTVGSTNYINNQGGTCGEANCDYSDSTTGTDSGGTNSGGTGSSGSGSGGTGGDSTDDGILAKYGWVLVILLIIIVVIVIAAFAYKKYKKSKSAV